MSNTANETIRGEAMRLLARMAEPPVDQPKGRRSPNAELFPWLSSLAARSTQETYAQAVVRLSRSLDVPVEKMTSKLATSDPDKIRALAEHHMATSAQRGVHEKVVRLDLAVAGSLLAWLRSRGFQAASIERATLPWKTTAWRVRASGPSRDLSAISLDALLVAAAQEEDDYPERPVRDRAILLLMHDSRLFPHEVVNLNVSDLDLDTRTLSLAGRPRQLTAREAAALKAWLVSRAAVVDTTRVRRLFVAMNPGARDGLTPRGLAKLIARIGTLADVDGLSSSSIRLLGLRSLTDRIAAWSPREVLASRASSVPVSEWPR